MSRRITQNSQITTAKIFSPQKQIFVLALGSLLAFSGCRMSDSSYDYCSPIFRGGQICGGETCASRTYGSEVYSGEVCDPLCDPLYRAGSIYYGRGMNGLTQGVNNANASRETSSDAPRSPNRSRVPSNSSPLPNLPRVISGNSSSQERSFAPESSNGKARFSVPNLDRKIPPASTYSPSPNENPVSPINAPREKNDTIFDTKPIPPSTFEVPPFPQNLPQNYSNTASENEDYGITLEALRKLDPTITDVKIMSVK